MLNKVTSEGEGEKAWTSLYPVYKTFPLLPHYRWILFKELLHYALFNFCKKPSRIQVQKVNNLDVMRCKEG